MGDDADNESFMIYFGDPQTNGTWAIQRDNGSYRWMYRDTGIYQVEASLINNGNGSQLNFTGQHRTQFQENNETILSGITGYIGLIVVSSGEYLETDIDINEALPKVSLSSQEQDKCVFGVISAGEDPDEDQHVYSWGAFQTMMSKIDENDTRVSINSLGEGGMWICDINGVLDNGDYITTCSVPGYGQKQSDDFLHNYTVAKTTQDVNFTGSSIRYLTASGEIITEAEYNTRKNNNEDVYKAQFIGVTYHCG
jgi:hypothetical protein